MGNGAPICLGCQGPFPFLVGAPGSISILGRGATVNFHFGSGRKGSLIYFGRGATGRWGAPLFYNGAQEFTYLFWLERNEALGGTTIL